MTHTNETCECTTRLWRNKLVEIGALFEYPQSPVGTTIPPHPVVDGKHANGFVQLSRLGERPELLEAACRDWVKLYAEQLPVQPHYVVGAGVSAQQTAHCLARALGCRATYTEATSAGHMLVATIPEGAAVVVARGTITSPESMLRTVECLRALEIHILRPLASIVNLCDSYLDLAGGMYPVRSLLSLSLRTFAAHECPLCAQGSAAIMGARHRWDRFLGEDMPR